MPRRFTLLDDVYYDALCTIVAALQEAKLPFCLVGGGANQAWVASLRTSGGERRIADEPILDAALRQTKDLDFSTRTDPATMVAILNRIVSTMGRGAHALGPRTLRLGPVAVAFTIGPDDLSGMVDLYDRFLSSRTVLRLRRGNSPDEIPAIGLEELLVTKLTRRGDKAKDMVDVVALLAAAGDAGHAVEIDAVRAMLGNNAEALGTLDDIVARSRPEREPS